MANLNSLVGEAKKAVVAVIGGAAELVALGVVHGAALVICQAVIAAGTAAGVYRAENK